jgi:integrase
MGEVKKKTPMKHVKEWKATDPPLIRYSTDYPGVYIRKGTNRSTGKPEDIFYLRYVRDGKRVEERAGRAKTDDMTAARASKILGKIIDREQKPRQERLKAERAAKDAEAGKMTFNRLWKAWQEDPENDGKRGTIKADQRYRKHIKIPFGDREPKDLKPLDIERFRLALAKDHAKSTTISTVSLINRIARYGASKGLCAGLSFPIILKGKTLGREPREKKAPTDEQFEAYVRTCEKWPDRQAGAFQLFIAYTGVRRGSARNLKWDDIDLDHQTAVLKDSKTGDVQIVLGDDAVALLRNHPREIASPYVFTGKGWEPVLDKAGKPALHRKNGKMRRKQTEKNLPQLSQRQIDRIPRMIADAAGLPADLDPCHSFRRRLATKVEARFGIAAAMGAGGWKSPAMVINYTATTKQTLRDAANLLGRKNAAAS